jgi:hypothetical protein
MNLNLKVHFNKEKILTVLNRPRQWWQPSMFRRKTLNRTANSDYRKPGRTILPRYSRQTFRFHAGYAISVAYNLKFYWCKTSVLFVRIMQISTLIAGMWSCAKRGRSGDARWN